jgi:hypothetical protein
MSAAEICSLVTYYVIDFEKLKKKEGEKRPKKKQKWEPPQHDYCYNINIDAPIVLQRGQVVGALLLATAMESS